MTDEKDKNENRPTYKDVIRFAFYYWKPNRKVGITAAVLMLSAVAIDAIIPIYTGKMIDAMTSHAPSDVSAADAAWMAFAYFTVLGFAQQGLRVLSMLFWNKFAVRNLYAVVTDGLSKVQRFSSDWHANTFAGGTVRKITRGMWSLDTFEDTLLMGLLPAITIMVGVTIMLSVSLPLVGAAAAFMITLYCALSIWMSVKILAPRFKDSAEADTKVGATLADIITGNPTVKTFGAEKREDAIFEGVATLWKARSQRAWQTGVAADAARSACRMLMTTSMVATTIFLWKTGKATPGDIVVVITTFFIIGGYLRDIGMHISHLQRSVSEMEDIVTFWMRTDEVIDTADAKELTIDRGRRHDLITFQNVTFRYGKTGPAIYKDMSIDIGGGEKLALVGPSGSGKSTFVKLIQRLYNVTEGQILIDGQDIAKVSMESLRRSIALVPQDPVLFHRSLSDNIAYGRPGATQEQIIDAAKKAYAHDFIMGLSHGYDTLVGERGVKLSGGERQRVAIARAILADAPILILDEATSSLDSISEHYIQMALDALVQGRTTITIAHRLSTIQKADRILVFDKGEIIEQGDHAHLMARPNSRYKALYDMQALDLVPEYTEEGSSDAPKKVANSDE